MKARYYATLGATLGALLALVACDGDSPSSNEGLATLSVVAELSGPLATAPPVDSVVVILSGPEQRRVSGSPGERITITALPPGTYTVRLEGYAGLLLVWDVEETVSVVAGQSTTATFTGLNVLENLPTVTVTSPGQDTTVTSGDALTLMATASDQEDGDLTAVIDWDSDVDGSLGTGGTVNAPGLSVAQHTITATVHDQESQAAVDMVVVTVTTDSGSTVSTIVVTSSIDTVMAVGRVASLTAVATDAGGNPVTVTFAWTSSNTSVATVSASGMVSAVSAGTTDIEASADDVTGSLSMRAVDADLPGVTATLGDAFVRAMRDALDPATATNVDGLFTTCSGHVTSGNLLALDQCLVDLLGTPGADGTDDALLGVLALFFEHARSQLLL